MTIAIFSTEPEDIPPYYHDKDFDKLNDKGAGPVFNDPRTQAANAKLMKSELIIGLNPLQSPATRARAYVIAVGIGAADIYNITKNEPRPVEGRDFAPMDP